MTNYIRIGLAIHEFIGRQPVHGQAARTDVSQLPSRRIFVRAPFSLRAPALTLITMLVDAENEVVVDAALAFGGLDHHDSLNSRYAARRLGTSL
jgi:hypothetical protein